MNEERDYGIFRKPDCRFPSKKRMKKLRVYLDTSVINFLFADDAPDFKSATLDFFENHAFRYDLFISGEVVLEIKRCRDALKRKNLEEALSRFETALLPGSENDEVLRLAEVYLELEVIPQGQFEDAIHVASATVHEMDILLSWNFKHLANVNREGRIQVVNHKEGYWRPLRLVSPPQLRGEDE